jgi:hypothetical protein
VLVLRCVLRVIQQLLAVAAKGHHYDHIFEQSNPIENA